MNGGKSDASTSTDDVKDRPLCLFYFTHPFGVLSPEPPTISAAPPSVTHAFLNMEPISPFYWPSSAAATGTAATQETPDESYRSTTPSTVAYELGDATVHHNPVSVVSVARARRCTVQLPRRDSSTLSSSLFASDVWFPSSGSGSHLDYPRRPRYTRILPPLQLPSPKDMTNYSSDDIWPRKCLNKFSLPPLKMPEPQPVTVTLVRSKRREELSSVESVGGAKEVKSRRKLGVNKARRRRQRVGDVRKMVTCLMRRAIRGRGPTLQECSASPALQHVLATIREAWTEPTSLTNRCRVLSRMYTRSSALERDHTINRDSERESDASAMLTRTQLTELPPRPDASPGLLCRRYSVPETIMRKYRLAQQNSDSEEYGGPEGVSGGTAECGACLFPSPSHDTPRSAGESPRHLRRDRELMRKSALLRRMWARPPAVPAPAPVVNPAACCCVSRSLDGSSTELRAESEAARARWPDHKRPRRDSRAPPSTADQSDSTRGPDLSSYVETDALSDGTATPPCPRPLHPASADTDCDSAPASLDTDAELPRAVLVGDRLYSGSDAFCASVQTLKETPGSAEFACSNYASSNERQFEGRVSARDPSVENDERNALSSERLVCDVPVPYEVLEIVVSESASSSPPDVGAAPRVLPHPSRGAARDLDIDEYVSRVLVESLNSLSDRLEGMNASVGADRKLSVVEKEIKVRLQNAAVNTIVHLSPTSNNQIIFGNEELCDGDDLADADVYNEQHCGGEPRDECNNPRTLDPFDERKRENNNASPSASPTPRTDSFDAILQHDNVNHAVLQQIQKLFCDDLRHEDREMSLGDDVGAVSHIEISNVDAFLSSGIGADTISLRMRDAGAPLAGFGAGNYFRDAQHAALVPRHSALPHSASMEVNTSSSEDAEVDALGSDAASLVDSLDDPSSPRAAFLRRPRLARSAVDVLDLLPGGTPRDSTSEAFFVGMRDDAVPAPESARVAECMPERIRQKLHRRHRKRELRMEFARRGKVRQLREELEQRRRDELARDCGAMVDALLDEVIAKIAQDEYRCMRIERRGDVGPTAARSQENQSRKTGRRDSQTHRDREPQWNGRHDARRRRSDNSDERSRKSERHQIRGKLLARPSLAPTERGPHRIYQKSEIHEGDKCIEILEILEYSHASRSSPDSTPTDESAERARGRRSRIPVPVHEHMRLTGGDTRVAPPLADLLLRALAPVPPSPLTPSEPRERCNSLRFKRVFDMIPEERASLSFDSSADAETEEVEGARRASAPDLIEAAVPALVPFAPVTVPVPAPAPVPPQSPRRVLTRSAGTSPPAEARRLRSQMTMTSPSSKSAATSPWRVPPPSPPRPPPRPPPPREGSREREKCDPMRPERRRSVPTQCDRERRGAESEREDDFAFRRARQPGVDRGGGAEGGGTGSGCADSGGSSSSGDSGGSLLCSLAPRWLSTHARHRRRPPRRDPPSDPHPPPPPHPHPDQNATGGWSVTVAGTCRAALPADVEMRLRFPQERRASRPGPAPAPAPASSPRAARHQECMCAMCAGFPPPPPDAPALPPARPPSRHDPCRLTLTMKKEAQDSCILASKSTRKSSEQLPDLETYRASRTKLKSSMKTRRGYSLHCWLPDDEPAPIRANNGLSVLGCAIIPELKPRVPTMSERDLTRVYTPRHYLRS